MRSARPPTRSAVGVEALQELRFAAKASGVEQQTLDMALQRFTRRAAEAAQGTGEAKDALAQMGIALRDQSGNLRSSEDLLGDVADAFARIEDPAERVRLAFKLFDSEGVALVNLLRGGSGALEEMRERARDLGIVLDEHLVRDAERARTELDTLCQVISANLTRAALEAAPVIADLSSWLADVAGKAGIAWERLFDAPEEKSLRTLRYELDLASSTIEKLEGRIQELRESPTLGFTTFLDTAQISALERKLDELRRARDQTQARIAFLEGPPDTGAPAPASAPAPDDTAGVQDRAKNLERIARELEGTLFSITHEGSERIIAEHERRVAEIEALRAKDGSNAQQVDQLIAQSAAVRDAQLSQLRAKEVEAAEKVRAANERVVASLEAERAALTQTERERFVAQALSRLSAEATAQQRREVEQLAGALFDEQQALQARQRLMDEGRSVIDRTRTATEQHAAEIQKLNELLAAGAIDQATYARAVEDANDRALRSSQAWTDGATRFLKDYVAESNDAATATERAFANAFGGAEDALVGFISYRQAGVPGSRRQHPRRPRAHDGAPDHHGPARRCAAERVRRRRPVRPVPRGRRRGRAAARGALCRCRGVRARAALPRRRLRRLRPPAGRGPDHRPARRAGRAARAGRARGEDGTRAAADHRGGQRHRRRRELLPCEPGPDRGRHGARDRSGEPEPMSGVQFRGAMETLKVLPWRLPQLLQRSFRSRSSSLVYGGRPCCSSLASMWVRFPQAAQVAKITCQARRSSSRMA